MNISLPITIFLVALGLLFSAAAHAATTSAKRTANNPYECIIEGEDGRRRPCSATYRQPRSEKNHYDCVTEDGYGRRLPCAAHYKR